MRLHGSICALVTPFGADHSLDLPAWERLLDLHLRAGTHGVVVGGSTGESGALDDWELALLLDRALLRCAERLTVIAAAGGSSTRQALSRARVAQAAGAQALLAVTPYYCRPTQAGLQAHYRALAETGVPLIAYNVPSRTGSDLLPETVAQLFSDGTLAAIKEARPEQERMQSLLDAAAGHQHISVLSGDDASALRSMNAGAHGVISVAANVLPRRFAHMCGNALAGDDEAALADHEAMQPVYAFLGIEPNPIPAKWLLARNDLIGPALRLPLLQLSQSAVEQGQRPLQMVTSELRSLADAADHGAQN